MSTAESSINNSTLDPVSGGEVEELEKKISPRFIVVEARTVDLFKNGALVGNPYDSKIGDAWDLTKDIAIRFIDVIERKFDNNNKFHGYFSPTSTHPSPGLLKDYVATKKDFRSLVERLMSNVCIGANEPGRSSLAGGHVVFVHYKNNEVEDIGRLLVVMVGKQSGFDFDSKLQPVGMTSINTQDLRQAAMFDLTLFSEIYPKNEGEAYLRFILGKSRSAFFKEALGCGNYIPNADSVSEVNRALTNFLESTGLTRADKLQVKTEVSKHLAVSAKLHKSVTVGQIEEIVDKFLPVGSDKKGKFTEFVNVGGYTVSAHFEPTPSSAESGVLVEVSDPSGNFKYRMNLSSIGYAKSKKPITVDDDLNYVMLPLDDEARDRILQIIGEADGAVD